jgi:transcriptional regulator with XRE-family HTH domain
VTIGERLRAERERLGLSQQEFSAVGGVHLKSQGNYEHGKRGAPDADYLAAIDEAGADVLYILTGRRGTALTPDERELLRLFRAAPLAVKASAIGALQGGGQVGDREKIIFAAGGGNAAGRNIIIK